STSTGLVVTASTTIGNGTQAGGLTIAGGATTTGSAYVAGTLNIGASFASLANPYAFSVVNATPSFGINALFENTTASGYSGFNIADSNGLVQASFGYGNASAPVAPNTLFFVTNGKDFSLTNSSTTNNANLVMSGSTGFIGIGTTSPFAALSVNGNGFFGGVLTAGSVTATSSALLASTTLAGHTLLSSATTTNFAITGVTGSLLKTLPSGAVAAAVAGTDYLTSANVASYPFPNTIVGNFMAGPSGSSVLTVNATGLSYSNSGLASITSTATQNTLTYGSNTIAQ